MTAPVPLGNFDWEPASWRQRAAAHQPDWPEAAELEDVTDELRRMPPLVFAGEARSLRGALAAVSKGDGFLLHAGDCAESFAEFTADNIRDGKKTIAEMAAQYGREAGDIGITVREPFKIDERLPADRDRPFVGPRGHVLDSFHEFQQLGVSHMVIDLFYSTSVLEDATLESMIGAMEVLAGIPGTHPEF